MWLFRFIILAMVLAACWESGSGGRAISAASLLWASPLQVTNPVDDRRAKTQQAKMLNANEKKQLLADADKLIQMSTLLKQQIDRTDPDSLSAAAIKNAGDIEKLAHTVKQGLEQRPYSPSGP